VRCSSGVHVPGGVWLSKVEGAESIVNVSGASSSIEGSLLRFGPKNSPWLGFGIIVGSIPICGWIRAMG
jgi:hypothetical protein